MKVLGPICRAFSPGLFSAAYLGLRPRLIWVAPLALELYAARQQ